MFKRLLTFFRAEKTPAEREAELVGKLFIALGQSQLALSACMARTESLSATVDEQAATLRNLEVVLAERDRNVNDLSASLEMEQELTAKLGTNYETLAKDHINLQAGLAAVREQRDNAQRRFEDYQDEAERSKGILRETAKNEQARANDNQTQLIEARRAWHDEINRAETFKEQFDGACAEIKERMDENEKLTNENILLLGDAVNMRDYVERIAMDGWHSVATRMLAAECLDRNSIVKRTDAEPATKENEIV